MSQGFDVVSYVMGKNRGGGGGGEGKTYTMDWVEAKHELTLSDGTTTQKLELVGLAGQVDTMPPSTASDEGKIVQYIGATDTNYTNGYFYECVEVTPATDPKTYEWKQKNVQAGGGGSGNASFELDKTNNVANITNQSQHLAFSFSNDEIEVTAADPGTYYNSKTLPTKDYVDGRTGVNFAVGQETWYGTYTDENNVVYQTYAKTIFIPALPSTAGITTYPIGVSNIKQIIDIFGTTTDGFKLNAPRQTVTDNITIYQVSKGSQTFSIEVGKDRSSKSAYVTIIYVKNN